MKNADDRITRKDTPFLGSFRKYVANEDFKQLSRALACVVAAQPPEKINELVQEFNDVVRKRRSPNFPYLELRPSFQKAAGHLDDAKLLSLDLHVVHRPAISNIMKVPTNRFKDTEFFRSETIDNRLSVTRRMAPVGVAFMLGTLNRLLEKAEAGSSQSTIGDSTC
jgi:hypothetical protein